MFAGLFRFFAPKTAKLGGSRCPRCLGKVKLRFPKDSREPWLATQHCDACRWAGSFDGMRKPQRTWRALHQAATRSRKGPSAPRHTVTEGADGEFEVAIPAAGTSGCLLPFAILWLVFSLAFIMLRILESEKTAWSGAGTFWLMAGGSTLIGVAMLYIGLRLKYASARLAVSVLEVALLRRFLGTTKSKHLSRDGIRRVALAISHWENRDPMHGIEIKGREGSIRFGALLEESAKPELCALLRDRLAPQSANAADEEPSAGVNLREEKGLSLSEAGGRVTVASGPESAVGGVAVRVVVLIVLGVFLRSFIRLNSKDSFEMVLFTIIPSAFAVVFFLGLVVQIAYLLSRHGTVTEVSADAAGVTWTRSRGRNVETVQIPKKDVLDVVQIDTSYRSGVSRWRGEVIANDHVYPFGIDASEMKLRRAVMALRRVLGFSQDNER